MNIIDQRFEVLEKLGEGGMGDVYKCTDNVLNKVVTVKILKQIGEGQNLFRFQQEAQALARLNHPNIVKVYDFKLTDTQNPILIMEYVKGIELKQLIEKNGPLTGKETETILLNIINGLDYAHKSGILHRDLKPANIIVTDTILLDLKIVDFGLAAMEEADHRLTATGVALGSPPYMSPEQISGSPTDQKTDIYSLGCLLFECLTGAPPFIGASALETMSMHINQPAPHLEDRPELEGSYFHEIISRCLEKAPEDRFSNLSEVEQLLKRQQLIDENKEVYNTQLDDKHNRLPLWWTTGAACLLVIASICYQTMNPGSSPIKSSNSLKIQEKSTEAFTSESALPEINEPQPAKFILASKETKCQWQTKGTFDAKLFRSALESLDLKQCTTLRLEKQIALRKEDYELLAKLPIEKLYLIGCNLTDEKLHVISKIKSLKGLYIDCSSAEFKSPNQISSKGIEALTRLPQLDYLALSRLPIDDSCLEPIGKSRTIKRISILTCQNIEGSGFKYLQDHDFDRVTLRQLKLSQRAVSNLAKIKINHLLLHSMDIDAALTNGLNQSKSMKELALESCKIKIGALQKLTRIPTLAIIQGQNGEKANEPTPLPAEVVDGIKCKNLTIEGGHITQKLARTLSMQKNRYLQLITVHIRFDELKIICRGKSLKRLKLVKVPGLKLKDAFALKKQFPDLKIDISHF